MNENSPRIEPALPELETCRRLLDEEICKWQMAGKTIELFLRDDDAVAPTPNLDRLLSITNNANVPLLLAIIPDLAVMDLADRLGDEALVSPAVHGFAHVNHASKHSPHGGKSCELGNHRPLPKVLGELQRGHDKLAGWFGRRLSSILVPPWNRISDEVRAHVDHVGFKAVSAHGWATDEEIGKNLLPSVNVHLDIFHWSGGRVGREFDWVWFNLADNLGKARERGFKPVGILTHHLVHDAQAWAVIEALVSDPVLNAQAKWVRAEDKIGAY